MIQFRNDFYADIRIEDRETTRISYKAGGLEEMKNRGFIIGKNGIERNVMAFQPPLVVTEEDINSVLNALDDVLTEVLK